MLRCHVDVLLIGVYLGLLMAIDHRSDLPVMRFRGQFKVRDVGRVVSARLNAAEEDGNDSHAQRRHLQTQRLGDPSLCSPGAAVNTYIDEKSVDKATQ